MSYHVTNDKTDQDLVAFSAKNKLATPQACKFDTDAVRIGVDSYTSRCVSPFIDNFDPGILWPLSQNKTI